MIFKHHRLSFPIAAILLASCSPANTASAIHQSEPITASCTATDGDTIRCGDERIRINAIQAADRANSSPCRASRPNYTCDDALYERGKEEMARLISRGSLTIDRVEKDRYGRTVAHVYVDGRSVACSMMDAKLADYWERYDEGSRVAHECDL